MLKRDWLFALTLSAFTTASVTAAEPARDFITIAGATTIYPFAVAVGEHCSKKTTSLNPPKVQGIGSGAGLKLFCAGVGPETLDIAVAVRPIKPAERELCAKNGVTDIIEVKFGTVATVVVQSTAGAKLTNLTRKELFLAMAKEVPDPKDGAKLVPNPYKTWKDINSALPNTRIVIWAPAEMHGIHDVLLNQIMLVGCQQIDAMRTVTANDPKALETLCRRTREDGAYIEFKEFSAAIKEVQANPSALGIMSQTHFGQDSGLTAIPLEGYEPSALSVAHQVYPVTESLLLYVKKAHANGVAGLKEYLAEFTSKDAIGTNRGYLGAMGVVTLPLAARHQARPSVMELAAK